MRDFLAAQALGGGGWKRSLSKPLHHLGLDSLELVQLRNTFNNKFGVSVPLGVFADSSQLLGDLALALDKYVSA